MNGKERTADPAVDFRYLLSQVWGEPRDRKLSAEEMAARRDERVRSMVRFACERVPWYGHAMRDRGLGPDDFRSAADLALLPVVEHEDLSSAPQAFLPTDIRLDDLLELKTSGSTMMPRRVYHDPEGIVAGWSVKLRERAIRDRIVGQIRYRSASLSMEGNPTRVRERLRLIAPAVGKLVSESPKYSVFEDLARVVEGLREWRPQHLSGYGSALGRLFRYLKDSGEPIPLPKVVTFSSDAVAPLERRIIEEDFGVPVLGIYSSTEAFAIGFECEERDGYHVHEDVSHVRIADPEGRSVEPMVPGSIIVSNLVNRGTVLLNYRQGDLGETIEGPCPCGRTLPRIRLLAGRDMLFIERAEGHPIHQFKLFRALQDVGLYRWQVVQTALQQFTVRVISLPGQERHALEARIRRAMTDLIGGGLEITIEYPVELERTTTGKVLAFFRR
ncbi:MAG TPA: hypothetical protein VFH11_02120 [Gemmatimonadota bacterium]|nr:hypothetical protein [Gemmatimonadota bacterium]